MTWAHKLGISNQVSRFLRHPFLDTPLAIMFGNRLIVGSPTVDKIEHLVLVEEEVVYSIFNDTL